MAPKDGDGWIDCSCGAKHWGVNGAAGVLIFDVDNGQVLMQHRAHWTHGGATWGIPGGARDSHETPVEAALRELEEEWGVSPASLEILHDEMWVDHGTWNYHTVIVRGLEELYIVNNDESQEARWVDLAQVTQLDLHPGFASSWERVAQHLRALIDAHAQRHE